MNREEILNGIISLDEKVIKSLVLSVKEHEVIEDMLQHAFYASFKNKGINTFIYYDQIGEKRFNVILRKLINLGYVSSSVYAGYAQLRFELESLLKYVTEEEINNIIYSHRFRGYMLTAKKPYSPALTKIGSKYKNVGLPRCGFCLAGNNIFQLDTNLLKEYKEDIAYNLTKDIMKSTITELNNVTYEEIVNDVISYYAELGDNEIYRLGNCISDSRGRAIFDCTHKIFNPIANKECRALIRTKEQPLDPSSYKHIYAFITELLGCRNKCKTFEEKVQLGQNFSITKCIPEDLKLSSKIWLQRIYDNLDHPESWNVPIEVDALASQMQLTAVLLNNYDYFVGTNLIGTELNDIWQTDYCSRDHIKATVTPILYGSGSTVEKLLDHNNLKYTFAMSNQISKEITDGRFKEAYKFTKFIINNVNPEEEMKINIYNEPFTIYCNRFSKTEYSTKMYRILTNKRMKAIMRKIYDVADLQSYRTFFPTLLLHHLDSRVADYVSYNLNWVIPIHDSFIIHPNEAYKAKELYTSKMYEIYKHRAIIIDNFLKSINIKEKYEETSDFFVEEFSTNCLK